ncbi:hypothetical protein [Pantoea sp. Fr+CA_20]|uniref:hypothetical protein n=1 Tax=Pantoea TaxID=53335 RepID=UPI0021183C37|nr:hypothetical protein [Pantoea sp. Fr+CA_20]
MQRVDNHNCSCFRTDSPVKKKEVKDAFLPVLARLHSISPDYSWTFSKHHWSEAALEGCMVLLRLPVLAERRFRTIQAHSNAFFEPHCVISDETNAGYWGKKEHGGIVLFDWERFELDSPATDLAPLVKGMGGEDDYLAMARRYCPFTGRFDADVLAKEIAIANAWIVVAGIINIRQTPSADFKNILLIVKL